LQPKRSLFGLVKGDFIIIFFTSNFKSKLENKYEFFFSLFVAKQHFFVGTKIIHWLIKDYLALWHHSHRIFRYKVISKSKSFLIPSVLSYKVISMSRLSLCQGYLYVKVLSNLIFSFFSCYILRWGLLDHVIKRSALDDLDHWWMCVVVVVKKWRWFGLDSSRELCVNMMRWILMKKMNRRYGEGQSFC
jgi:hypothetical protein